MSMSNYPPGVTGREYQISGPDREWEDERECEACGKPTLWHFESHPHHGTWGYCSECDLEEEITEGEE